MCIYLTSIAGGKHKTLWNFNSKKKKKEGLHKINIRESLSRKCSWIMKGIDIGKQTCHFRQMGVQKRPP